MISISSKNFIWNYWATKFLLATILISSCSTPKEIGEDLFSVEVGINYTDTISIQSSTILLDSIYSDHSNALLLGSYYRPEIGTIEASFFSQLSNTDSLTADENSIYKGLKLGMIYSFNIGDASKEQSFTIHQLTDTLDIYQPYFSDQEVNYDPTPLATINFKPNVFKYRTSIGDTLIYDTLVLDMDEAFGRKLFDYYKTPNFAAGGKRFRQNFKGLYFKSNNTDKNASILSFNPGTTVFQLSYRKAPSDTVDKKITYYFALNDFFGKETQTRNTVFKVDRSDSYISNLTNLGLPVPATDTRNMSFISAAGKMAAVVDIPYLKQLAKDKNIAVNRAELMVPIVDDFDLNYMMATLNLARIGADNKIKRSNGFVQGIAEEGSSSTVASANYTANTKSFNFNVTTLVQNIISGKERDSKFLIIPPISTQVNGKVGIKAIQPTYAAINSAKIKLRIYYSYLPK